VVAQHRQSADEPLRPAEFVIALMAMSLIRLAVGVVPVTFMAIEFLASISGRWAFAFAAFFVVLIVFAERRLAGFGSSFCATGWARKISHGR